MAEAAEAHLAQVVGQDAAKAAVLRRITGEAVVTNLGVDTVAAGMVPEAVRMDKAPPVPSARQLNRAPTTAKSLL